MRREMSSLKKQLQDVQGNAHQAVSQLAPTQLAPATFGSQPATFSETEEAVAEEYIEPEREPENLNVNDWSRQALEKALERNGGNRKKAAQELGISDRTLYRRLKQYGLAK